MQSNCFIQYMLSKGCIVMVYEVCTIFNVQKVPKAKQVYRMYYLRIEAAADSSISPWNVIAGHR